MIPPPRCFPRFPPTQLAVSAIFYGQVGSKASLLLLLTIPLRQREGLSLKSKEWLGDLKSQPLVIARFVLIGNSTADKIAAQR